MNDRLSLEPGLSDETEGPATLWPNEDGRNLLAGLLKRSAFEIFPLAGIETRLDALPEGTPVTITCSPTQGIVETLALTEKLRSRGFRVIPHISARLVRDDAHLHRIVKRLASLEVADVFVIGGDVKRPAGEFSSTLSLLDALRDTDHPFESIGVAGYPEGHPFLDDHALIEALRAKEPFATYLVTQMCFDPAVIVGWVEGIRRQGLRLPVHIGLPGATHAHRLLRFSLKIGVGDSARFLTKHSNLVMRLARSSYRPDDLIRGLAPRVGDPALKIGGFHLYTFNEVAATESWRNQLMQDLEASKTTDAQGRESDLSTKGERDADPL